MKGCGLRRLRDWKRVCLLLNEPDPYPYYDGHNRRIKSVKDNGKTEYSFYSQSGKLLYRETEKGPINYIFLGSKLVGKEGAGAQSSQSSMHYKPFGDSIETAKDEVGYTGHKFDKELGLSYMQARYYDPVIGRFMSNDPVGFSNVHNFNRYTYANNNPYKYIDPNGQSSAEVLKNQVTESAKKTAKNILKSKAKEKAKEKAREILRKAGMNEQDICAAENCSGRFVSVSVCLMAKCAEEVGMVDKKVPENTEKAGERDNEQKEKEDDSNDEVPEGDKDDDGSWFW